MTSGSIDEHDVFCESDFNSVNWANVFSCSQPRSSQQYYSIYKTQPALAFP